MNFAAPSGTAHHADIKPAYGEDPSVHQKLNAADGEYIRIRHNNNKAMTNGVYAHA